MKRETLARLLALLDIVDDYESLDHVAHHMSSRADVCRIAFTRKEAIDNLSELIQSGLAKAYRLSHYDPVKEINGVPSLEDFEDDYTYFYATPQGIDEIRRMWKDPDRPFDEDGDFRPDRCPE